MAKTGGNAQAAHFALRSVMLAVSFLKEQGVIRCCCCFRTIPQDGQVVFKEANERIDLAENGRVRRRITGVLSHRDGEWDRCVQLLPNITAVGIPSHQPHAPSNERVHPSSAQVGALAWRRLSFIL